jgi:hypothetical protein
MTIGKRHAPALAVFVLSASLAACEWFSPKPKVHPPLAPAAQQAAAEKLATAFAGACISEPDPAAATAALQAAGWPPFRTVWRQPASVFYAAPQSPAGLFVTAERPWGGAGAQQISCVGHYSADGADPMVAAVTRRWGPPRDSDSPYPRARIWTFRMSAGTVTQTAATGGISPDEASRLPPGDADVFVRVFYNPTIGDVASVIAVSRSTR